MDPARGRYAIRAPRADGAGFRAIVGGAELDTAADGSRAAVELLACADRRDRQRLLAAVGGEGVNVHGLLTKVVAPAVWAPLLPFVLAGLAIVVIYRIVGRRRPGPVTRGFRSGQIVSGSLLALAHGTNDAQKTMGVISLALVAYGSLSSDHFQVPLWVVIVSATAMALGTYAGGWRIIRTVGSRIIRMDPAQGLPARARARS